MSGRIFIVDTNVVVAGLITAAADSPTAGILDAMLDGGLFYLLSPALLREYREVSSRPSLRRRHGLDEAQIDRIMTEIAADGIWRDPAPATDLSAPDPGDAHLWALLASEPTAILITGDRRLVDSPMPQRSVISPATWAEHFAKKKAAGR